MLFVGIGIDFSIQYSVRYRAERHEIPDLREAIRAAGHYVAAPLTLAGFATALGFFSFLPTHYKGVSELGVIAGCGMLIAYRDQRHRAAGADRSAQPRRASRSRSAIPRWRRSTISSTATVWRCSAA